MQQSISVLLVDDQPEFRRGLHALLDFYSTNDATKFVVVGEAASAEQALKLVVQQHPALILLDMELAAQDGIAVLQGLKSLSCKSKVLVLSGHREGERIFRAMQAGASGYIYKEQLPAQLSLAVQTVMNGQVYLSPDVATSFFQLFHLYTGQPIARNSQLHFTSREHEVLNWLIQGASNEEIANHLHVTIATVKAHLTAIFNKLEVTSRTQAIIKALKLGLVSC